MLYFSRVICFTSLAFLAAPLSQAAAQQGDTAPKALQTDEAKIANAISAAPETIGRALRS